MDKTQRNIGLDWLRIIAITVVLFRHFYLFPPRSVFWYISQYGQYSIELFFVLSGYLIGFQILKQLNAHKFSFKTFYLRRTLRIAPLYFAVTLIYKFIPEVRETSFMEALWKFLTFTVNLHFTEPAKQTFTNAWSLCVEEHFYILIPFILFSFRKSIKYIPLFFMSLILFSFACRYYLWESKLSFLQAPEHISALASSFFTYIYFPSFAHFDSLILGSLLAWMHITHKDAWDKLTSSKKTLWFMFIATFALCLFISKNMLSKTFVIFGFTTWGLFFSTCLLIFINFKDVKAKTIRNASALLADSSFVIYLIHSMFFKIIQSVTDAQSLGLSPNGFFIFIVFVITAISIVIHKLIERPILKLRDKLYVHN